ncbi:MAG: LacI family DNA-binding transcriptional regulator [Propionibacteriaceae bacterium]|nr:LacI family DNA-binding transcriptional regulator [Propionibacteriaceae bacterium]
MDGRLKPQQTTTKDVARLAGVSTAVVSYVVNDGPRRVAPATRQKVLDAIQQLGYQPNATARALKMGTNHTYGMMVRSVTNTFHATMLEAVYRRMSERGYSMILAHGDDDLDRNHRTYEEVMNRGVEGLVVLMSGIDDDEWLANRTQLPVVLLDRETPVFGCATIGADYLEAGRLATLHLIEHGRKHIVPISGPMSRRSDLRLQGYLAAVAEAGLRAYEPIRTSWDRVGGGEGAIRVLDEHQEADALFCFSDMIGIGALQALQERQISIPDDIALVSFDGTDAARFSYPAMTSVNQPIEEMAECAVNALVGGGPQAFTHQVFPVSLSPRVTCGCVGSRPS